MLNRILDAIDDFIIDRVFQPICDLVRKLTGWSKKVPIATTMLIAVTTIIPFCVLLISRGGPGLLFGTLMLLSGLLETLLAYTLLQKEFSKREQEDYGIDATLDAERLRGKLGRMLLGTISVFILPGIVLLILFTDERELGFRFLIYVLAMNASVYFQACTDLPPGKNIFVRAREWLVEAFLTPAHTPARQ